MMTIKLPQRTSRCPGSRCLTVYHGIHLPIAPRHVHLGDTVLIPIIAFTIYLAVLSTGQVIRVFHIQRTHVNLGGENPIILFTIYQYSAWYLVSLFRYIRVSFKKVVCTT